MRLFENLSREELKEQARKTLRHEFMHHLERRGGLEDLEIEDQHFLMQYLTKKK